MVLPNDNFRTIVDTVAEGRQLFQNLRVAFAYLLLIHMPIDVGAAAISVVRQPAQAAIRAWSASVVGKRLARPNRLEFASHGSLCRKPVIQIVPIYATASLVKRIRCFLNA